MRRGLGVACVARSARVSELGWSPGTACSRQRVWRTCMAWRACACSPGPQRQVLTNRGFLLKLLLASSDLNKIKELDDKLTKCLSDMKVGG